MSSVVLALVVVFTVATTARRRRGHPLRLPLIAFIAERRLLRLTVQAALVVFAAGAVLLMFGESASAQSVEDPPAEPPAATEAPPAEAPVATEAPPVEPPAATEAPPVEPPAATEAPPVEPPAATEAPPAATEAPPAATEAPPAATEAAPAATAEAPAPAPSEPDSAPLPTEPTVTPSTWNISIDGDVTISSDGTNVTIDYHDGRTDVVKPLSEIADIVVTGGSGADTLTLADQLDVPLMFEGGDGADRIAAPSAADVLVRGAGRGGFGSIAFSGVETVAGASSLTMPDSGATALLTGRRQGQLLDSLGALLVAFADIADVLGGAGDDTFLAGRSAELRSLRMGGNDRLVVDIDPSAGSSAVGMLTLGSAWLDGTLEIRVAVGASSSTSELALRFLSFTTSSGDFHRFRGLDRGQGTYVKPVRGHDGYELAGAALPDQVKIAFQSAASGDDFYAFLAGKANTFAAGTQVAIDMHDHRITGELTLGGTSDAALLGLRDANLGFGDASAPLVTLADDEVMLTLTPTDLSGTISGALTTTVPGVAFGGTFTVLLDSDDGSVTAVGGADATVTIAGHTFSAADVTLTATGAPGARQVRIAGLRGATVGFGDVLVATVIEDGVLVLTADGVQGTLLTTVSTTTPGVAFTGPFALQVDTTGPANVVRLSGTGATLTAAGAQLTGSITLDHVTTASGVQGVAVGVADMVMSLNAVLPILLLAGVAGAFLLTSGGVAGRVTTSTNVNSLGLAISAASTTVELNSTGVTVDETFIVDGATTTVHARGPPAGGASDINGSRTVLTAGPLTLTVANSENAGPVGPTAWYVDLSGPAGRSVALTMDGPDLLLTFDGVAVRRSVAAISTVVISGSDGSDTLLLDAVPAIPVTFDGGGGVDTIRGPARDTTWLVNGAGAGTVGTVAFSGVEHLTGAAGNQDTFAFTAGGSLAGLVSGGDGGWDTMRFDGGTVAGITYVPTSPDAGRVLVGGRTFQFAGLEPVTSSVTAADVTVTFGTPNDTIILTTDATTGRLVLLATAAEDFDFAHPTASLTINVGDGNLTIQGTVNLGAANLTVNNARSIIVTGTLTGGTIVLNATRSPCSVEPCPAASITVANGASIIASGDLTLAVTASTSPIWTTTTPFLPSDDADGQMSIGAATLQAANVTLTVDATTRKFGQFELDELRLREDVGAYLEALVPGMAEGTLVEFVDGGDAPDSITRADGSWLLDGFLPNNTIRVTNSTSNDGFYRVTAVTATTLTLDASAELTAEPGDSEVVIEAVVVPTGDPALTFGAQIVIRDAGDWVADGFRAGQTVRIEGTPDGNGDGEGDNDGEYALMAVSPTTLTLDAGPAPGLVTQGPLTGVKIWAQGNPAILPIAVVDQNVQLRPETVILTFTDNGATGDTITRATGSWIADGFAVNQFAIVDGPTRNRGSYLISAVTATVLTIADPGTLTNETVAEGVEVAAIALLGGANSASLPGLTFADGGATITRSSGTWAVDGFAVGQTIEVANTKSNNGTYKISAIDGAVLTLATGTTLKAENTADNDTDPEVVAVLSLVNPELTFDAKKITRSRGSWVADGFVVGDRITIHGATVNQGQFIITAVTATEMTLDLADSTPFAKETLRDVQINRLLPYSVVETVAQPATVGGLALSLLQQLNQSTGVLDLAAFFAQVIIQEPSATLTIGSGAVIRATTGNVTASAKTTSQLRMRTDSLWIGVNYGRSNATATLTVAAGSLISALGGDVALSTDVTNELKVATIVTTGINVRLMYAMKTLTGRAGLVPGPALTAAVGYASSQSSTTVASGAVIEGADVTISATNSNDFQVSSTSAVRGLAKANTGVAIGVVVSNIDSDANVSVGGTIRTTGDLTISAESIGVYNYSEARATLQADKGAGIGGGKSAKVAEALKDIELEPTSDPSAISAGGAVVVATSRNDASAVVATGARLSVRGNLLVTAYAEDNFKSYAITIATLESKPDASGSIATVSLAGAVVVSNYHNGATARIGNGAIVNVADALTVRAEAVIPSQLTLDDLFTQLLSRPIFSAPPSPNIDTSDPLQIAQQVSDAAKAYLAWVKDSATAPLGFINGVARPVILMAKYIPNLLVTTNVGALSGGKKLTKDNDDADSLPQEEDRTSLAISGTVTVISISNVADASIGTGAVVNDPDQGDPAFPVVAASTQHVEVIATTDARLINLAGLAQPVELKAFLLGIGTTGKVGIGGTYQGVTVSLGARATIEDGAQVAALTDVDVTALNRSFIVVVTQQGGNATQVGISGAFTLLDQTSVAQALIEDTAIVETGGDLNVTATNDPLAVTISAVIQRGGRVAVGVGIAVNSFDTTTKALIAGVAGTPSPVATIGVRGDLTITALSDLTLYAFGAAASQPLTEKMAQSTKLNPTATTDKQNETGSALGNDADKPVYGFGLSADIAVNFIKDTTEAGINILGTVTVDGAIDVSATTKAFVVAVAGAVVFNTAIGGVTLAGAFSWNEFSGHTFHGSPDGTDRRVTQAYVTAGDVDAASLRIVALTDDRPITITAGLGIAPPKKEGENGGSPTTINIAGSATVAQHRSTTEAFVGAGTNVDVDGDVVIEARRALDLLSVTGAIAFRGTAAIGAAVEVQIVADLVRAYIDDGATVTAGGNIRVTMASAVNVISVAAALAIMAQNLNLPISVDVLVLGTSGGASIDAGATVDAGKHFLLEAGSDAKIVAVAGAGAFLGAGIGIGLAVGVTSLTRNVAATVGVGATITQGSNLQPGDPPLQLDGVDVRGVRIDATVTDDIMLIVLSGAAGQQPVAVALSPAIIIVNSTASSKVTGATITGTEVAITAQSAPHLYGLAIAGSVAINSGQSGGGAGGGGPPGNNSVQKAALTLAGAAAGTINLVESTSEAIVEAGSTITSTSGSITVRATDDSDVTADAGGVALAWAKAKGDTNVTATFGVAFAINEIVSKALASVAGSELVSDVDIIVEADSSPEIDALAVAGSLAVGTGGSQANSVITLAGAGAGAGNTIINTVSATVTGFELKAEGGVLVRAHDDSDIGTDAGGVAISANTSGGGALKSVAVGLSIALNKITNTVTASIDPTTVVAEGVLTGGTESVVVEAISTAVIRSLTIAGAGGSGAGAGAGSGNTISNKITANVSGGSTITAAGDVRIEANDRSSIVADAGGVAIAINVTQSNNPSSVNAALSVGIVVAINRIANDVKATVVGSTIAADGAVSVLATSVPTIRAFTLAVAVSIQKMSGGSSSFDLNFAGAGSGSGNKVDNIVEASVTGSTLSGTTIKVIARMPEALGGDPTIWARTIGVTFGLNLGSETVSATLTVGVAVAVNSIGVKDAVTDRGNAVRAIVDASTLTAPDGIVVHADVAATIEVFAIGVSVAVAVPNGLVPSAAIGVGGAVVLNEIRGDVDAQVRNGSDLCAGTRTGTACTPSGAVEVSVDAIGRITAIAIAPVLSGTIGQGGSIAIGFAGARNVIGRELDAAIVGAATRVVGTAVLVQATTRGVISVSSTTAAGSLTASNDGIALTISGAGAGASNTITDNEFAHIDAATVTAIGTGPTDGSITVKALADATITSTIVAAAASLSTSGSGATISASIAVSISLNKIANDIDANVTGGARLTASRDILVSAGNEGDATNLVGAGNFSGSVGSGGSVALSFVGAAAVAENDVRDDILASIDGATTVVSALGTVTVDASSVIPLKATVVAVSFSLAVTSGAVSVGLNGAGASAKNTLADRVESRVVGATVTGGGGVTVSADAGTAVGVPTITATAVAVSVTITASSGSFVVNITVSVAETVNEIDDVVLAGIRNGANVCGGGRAAGSCDRTAPVRVLAVERGSIKSTAGVGNLGGGFGSGGGLTIAVALVHNELNSQVEARIEGGATVQGSAIEVAADQIGGVDGLAVAVTVGITVGDSAAITLSGAGAQVVNQTAVQVRALVVASTLISNGPVDVTAENEADTPTTPSATAVVVAVSVAIAAGSGFALTVSVAVALASNTHADVVEAAIQGGSVTAVGVVSVSAVNSGLVKATVVAGSIGANIGNGGSLTIAVARAVNTVTNTITAAIRGGAVVTGSRVNVTAESTSPVDALAVAVGVSIGISGSGFAVALSGAGAEAVNTRSDVVVATINGSSVTAGLSVTVGATAGLPLGPTPTFKATVAAVAVSVTGAPSGVAVSVAVGVATATNTNSMSSVATITNGATVCVGSAPGVGCGGVVGPVFVSAVTQAAMEANVGAGSLAVGIGSGGSIGIGVALATNTATSAARAAIDGGSTVGAATVFVTADVIVSVKALAVAIGVSIQGGQGVAVALTGTGANATNVVRSAVTATIATIAGTRTSVTALAGGVFVQANEHSTLTATGAGGSLALAASTSGVSVAGAVGVGLASNTLASGVTASIDAATVTAAGGVVVAAVSDAIDSAPVRMTALAVAVAVSLAIANPESGIGVGLSGAGSNATNLGTSVVVATIRGGANVTGASVRVTALDTTTATATSDGFAIAIAVGVGLAIGVALATSDLSVIVEATIDAATVTAAGGSVDVIAQSIKDAEAVNLVLSISVAIGIAGAGANAVANVGGATTARLGAGAVVSTGALTVLATTESRSHAKADGGAGSIVAVAVMLAKATTTIVTSATIGTGVNVARATSIAVTAERKGVTGKTETTLAELVVGGVGLLAGAGGRAEATDSGAVRALVGNNLDVATTGAMTVTATSTTLTKASASGGGGGGVVVIVPTAYATHSADTSAAVGADTDVTAASLAVLAQASTTVRVNMFTLGIAVAGGVGGDAQAQSSGLTEARVGPAFGATQPTTTRRIAVTGELSIRALINQDVMADTAGGAGGLVGIGAITVRSFADGSSRAFIGNGTTVQAGTLTVLVGGVGGGPAIRSAVATSTVGTVAIAGGAGSNSTSGVRGSLDAFIGAGARVTVVAAAIVSVDGRATATADARGGSAGAINIAAFFATATIAPIGADPIGTRAWIGPGVTLSAAGLSVTATATDTATATLLAVAIALAAGSGGDANATIDSDVEAFIGSRDGHSDTVVTVTNGNVDVTATATQTATAPISTGTGGGLTVSWLRGDTKILSTVQAVIGTTVTATGSVTLTATQTALSEATTIVGTVGLISVGGAEARSLVGGTVAARLGPGAMIDAGGALTVTATTSSRSHARSEGGGGAALAIAAMIAEATTTVTTSASIETGTIVEAATVTVTATRQSTAAGTESTFGEILVVGIGLAAGAGGRGDATDSGDVIAAVADGVVVTTGVMVVTATSVTLTKGVARGGAGGGVAVIVPNAHATHSGDTLASVGADTGVTATTLSVSALATTDVKVETLTVGVGLAGGAGSEAEAQSSGLTEARVGAAFGTTSPADPRQVVVSGAVTIAARVAQTAVADTAGGTGGAIGVGGIKAEAFVDGSSRALVGNGASVRAASLTVEVTGVSGDSAVRTATANSTVGSVALIAAAFSTSTSRVSGSLDAFIGATATIVVTGAVIVRSTGTATATSDARGGSGGGITVSAFFATATIAPISGSDMGTRAWVGGGANVQAGSLRVAARATDNATATILAVSIALAGGAGGSATATIDADVEAFIGARDASSATVVTTTSGNVDVLATSTQNATATGSTGAGGAVAVAFVNATASIGSAVQAFIGDGTRVTAAGAVTLQATQTAIADTSTTAGGAAGLSISGATATSTMGGSANAAIGSGAVISATGALSVLATTSARSHARAQGGDGGGLTISVMNADAFTTQTTNASIGNGTTVSALGAVQVIAQRGGIAGLTETTFGEILVVGIGFASGAGGHGDATDSGDVTAAVGDGVVVFTTSGMFVRAISPTLTKGVARGGSGGGVAVIVPVAHATHSGDTLASVGADTALTATLLAVVASVTTDVRVEVLTVGIGLAGGAGSDAQAQSSGLTEARVGPAFGTTAPATRGVNVSGDVVIRAIVAQTAVADTAGGTGGAIGIGGLTVRAFVDGSSRAFIGNGARVQAGTLSVEVVGPSADSVRTATANSTVGSVALIAAAFSTSTSRISGSLDAFVGDSAVVTVTNAMVVRSTGTATSTADARGGSGGGITVSAFFATATIAPISGTDMGTRAWTGGGANVRAGSLSVTARATDNATATILAVSIALAGGAGGSATATVDSDVEAFIGPRSGTAATVIVTTGGAVEVLATSTQNARATGSTGAGGVVAVAFVNATSTIGSAVQALIGGGANVTAAGAITLQADQTAVADASTTAGGAGGLSISGATATSTMGGAVNAAIGAATISASGHLGVGALTGARSHARAQGGDGGGLTISVMNATASTTVTTSAGIGPGATVTTAASIGVLAQRRGVAGFTETTFGEILVAGVGFASGAGGNATATDSGAVTAAIGDNSAVTASGDVQVVAISETTTKATARGGAGGGAAVIVPNARATHSATTSAAVGSNTGVAGASLDVIASATTDVKVETLTVGIGLAGGAGSFAHAESSGLTEARVGPAFGTSAPATRGVVVTGAALIRAAVSQSAVADTAAGAGGAIGVGGIRAEAFVDGTSRAFIGNGAMVQAGTLTVEVGGLLIQAALNPALRTATANSTVGSVALVGGAGSSSTTRISGSLDGFIGDGATVVVTGAAVIRSTGRATSTADARGGSGGGITVSAFFATATIAPTSGTDMGTRAWVGGGANVQAGSLRIAARATDNATATLLAVSVALAGGAGGSATATVDSDVEAFIGPRTGTAATVIVTTGNTVEVLVLSTQNATATGSTGAGGGVAVAFVNATSTISSAVQAFIGGGANVTAAGAVTVQAVATANADATTTAGGAGGLSISGATATSTMGGSVNASIGAATIRATGSLGVVANAATRSHARAQGGDGGGLTISVMNATASTTVTTSAAIGPGATVINAASIDVTAQRGGIAGFAETTFGEILVAGVGFVSGAGGNGTATDSGAVTAAISDNSAVTSSGAVQVVATSVTTTKGDARGGAGGGVAVIVPTANATHSATTSATVGSNTGVNASSLDVVASATTGVRVDALTVGIGLAGGAGSKATALSSGTTEARIGPAFGTNSPANPRQSNVTGAVLIRAAVAQTATADARGGTGGAIGIGGLTVEAFLDGSSRAFIGNGARVQAGSLTIDVGGLTIQVDPNPVLRTATATSVIGSVALVAAGGSSSTTRVSGSLEAFIGAGATVAVTGAAVIRSNGTATASSDARGGSGGGIGISAFFATATVAPTSGTAMGTRASIGAGANVTAGSMRILATATDTATATLLAVAVALGAGAGGNATSTIDNDVEAFIGLASGSAATVVRTTGGILDVIATSSQSASAPVTGGAGGGIAVAFLNGNTTVQSTVQAFIGDGTTVAAAGTVQLHAEVVNAVASSSVSVGSGGVVSVAGVSANATSKVTTRAWIGDGVTMGTVAAPVNGDVIVTAIGRGEADAAGRADGGGGIQVASPRAVSTVDPEVDAHVGTAAGGVAHDRRRGNGLHHRLGTADEGGSGRRRPHPVGQCQRRHPHVLVPRHR